MTFGVLLCLVSFIESKACILDLESFNDYIHQIKSHNLCLIAIFIILSISAADYWLGNLLKKKTNLGSNLLLSNGLKHKHRQRRLKTMLNQSQVLTAFKYKIELEIHLFVNKVKKNSHKKATSSEIIQFCAGKKTAHLNASRCSSRQKENKFFIYIFNA